jgi:DNA invertase Pin-like site-specific DNA recombinase
LCCLGIGPTFEIAEGIVIGALEKFRQLGVDFLCLKQDLDTTTSGGRLLFHVIASVCEFERDLIRERTMAGMAEARRKGKHIGRPPLKKFDEAEEREIRTVWQKDGVSVRQLALRFATTEWMIRKILVEKQNADNENRSLLR